MAALSRAENHSTVPSFLPYTWSMQCAQCSAIIDVAALKAGACPYCKAALPHLEKAHEKAAFVQALMADRDGDGVPDIFASPAPRSTPGIHSQTSRFNDEGIVHSTVTYQSNVIVNGEAGAIPPEAQAVLDKLQQSSLHVGSAQLGTPFASQFSVQQTTHTSKPAHQARDTRKLRILVFTLFILVALIVAGLSFVASLPSAAPLK